MGAGCVLLGGLWELELSIISSAILILSCLLNKKHYSAAARWWLLGQGKRGVCSWEVHWSCSGGVLLLAHYEWLVRVSSRCCYPMPHKTRNSSNSKQQHWCFSPSLRVGIRLLLCHSRFVLTFEIRTVWFGCFFWRFFSCCCFCWLFVFFLVVAFFVAFGFFYRGIVVDFCCCFIVVLFLLLVV